MSIGRAILLIILAAPCILCDLQCQCTYPYNNDPRDFDYPKNFYSKCKQGSCSVNSTACANLNYVPPEGTKPPAAENKPACVKSYHADAGAGETGYTCGCVNIDTEEVCEKTKDYTTCYCFGANCFNANGAANNVVGFGIMVSLVTAIKMGFF